MADNSVASLQEMSPAGAPAVEPPAVASTTPLQNAFRLGWMIVELKARIEIAELKSRSGAQLTGPRESSIHLSSVWRSGFSHLATLLESAFPVASTAETLYDPPGKEQLPYLYPPEPDYANVGIVGQRDGKPRLPQFRLFEVTRRAINCLTMLYVNEQEALIPEIVHKVQARLVAEILEAAKHPESGGGDEAQAADSASAADALQRARQVLTQRIAQFLDAWDGYTRENYFNGGVIQNNDLELIAYEAGHSISSMSWAISVQTARARAATADPQARIKGMISAWRDAFRPQAVTRLQHQITALSTALDDAYYKQRPSEQRPSATDGVVAVNPDLPSHAIQCVKQSLDYWQRAVEWLCKNKWGESATASPATASSATAAEWTESMRLALVEQAKVWQTLLTGQQTLRAFTIESVTRKIFEDVSAEIQRAVRKDLKGTVQQAQRAAMDAISEAGHMAARGLDRLFSSTKQWLLLAVAALMVMSVGVILLDHDIRNSIVGSLGSAGSLLAGWVGFRKLKQTKESQEQQVQTKQEEAKTQVAAQGSPTERGGSEGQGLLSRIENAAEGAAAEVLNAFARGYKQVRVELDVLGQNIAVTYPLLEVFIWRFQEQGDVEFINNVLWTHKDRDAEIRRITTAALGPYAALVMGAGGAGDDEPAPTAAPKGG